MTSHQSTIDTLLGLLSEEGADQLAKLLVKEKLLWQCPLCDYYNHDDRQECRECHAKTYWLAQAKASYRPSTGQLMLIHNEKLGTMFYLDKKDVENMLKMFP